MTAVPATDVNTASLAELDPEVATAMAGELSRQRDTLEMIASENFVPRAVLEAQGSVLTNKYAEGYPGRRYYGGCEFVDVVEDLARGRAKEVFGAEFANVQPHAGAQANAAVLMALMNPGEKLMGMDLAHGGHLTHGMKLNFSGKLYEVASYGVREDTHVVDMDQVRETALREKPQVLIAAGPRTRVTSTSRRSARSPTRSAPSVGRHGALRRSGRRRPASVAGPACGRRLHHRPQDPRWPPLRHDPGEEGVGEEAQLLGVPRPAGRPAHARDRREGRRDEDRRPPEFKARQERTLAGSKSSPSVSVAPTSPATALGAHRWHRRPLVLVDLRHSQLDGQQVRICSTRSASPSTHAVPSTRARR